MKIGIAGSGSIVPVFLEAVKKVEEVEVCAIAGTSRSIEKLRGLCEEYQIEKYYDDYEKMLKSDDIDSVYIAVPNSLHYEFSKLALEHGKHVLCEKPFCSNADQAEELADYAVKHNLYLHEAVSPENFPCFNKMKEVLPELGEIKIIELNYSQYSRRYDAFKQGNVLPVFDPKLSGGALMDLNVYNIHFMAGLFGMPKNIAYYANIEKNIDTSGVLIMEYEDFKCVSIAAKDCKAPMYVTIQGNKGYIHGDLPAHMVQKITIGWNNGQENVYEQKDCENRLYYELKTFADLVGKNLREKNRDMLKRSVNVQKILDMARRQAGIEIQG